MMVFGIILAVIIGWQSCLRKDREGSLFVTDLTMKI